MSKVLAIIPAAGQGKRMGNRVNKQFMSLAGLPILVHTLRAVAAHPEICGIIVVCREDEITYFKTEILGKYPMGKVLAVVAGGRERQQSVLHGLQAAPANTELVLIHDGARPFVTADIIDRGLRAAGQYGAAIAGVPAKDTIKEAGPGEMVNRTLERSRLWQIQTPQVFDFDLILKAYQQAEAQGYLGTDDASLLERLGHPVKLVMGSYENIKITTPEDLWLGEGILRNRTEGSGGKGAE